MARASEPETVDNETDDPIQFPRGVSNAIYIAGNNNSGAGYPDPLAFPVACLFGCCGASTV